MVLPTTAQRQQVRRRLGSLQSNIIQKVTLTRYTLYFTRFWEFLKDFSPTWPDEPDEYDSYLTDYLEMLWDTGEPKTAAAYTLAAIHHYIPTLKESSLKLGGSRIFGTALSFPVKPCPCPKAICLVWLAGSLAGGNQLWVQHASLGLQGFSGRESF